MRNVGGDVQYRKAGLAGTCTIYKKNGADLSAPLRFYSVNLLKAGGRVSLLLFKSTG
jgi:hypothetical protein